MKLEQSMTEEIKLLQTMDAMVWAKEFLRINPNTGLDESTMLTWFANAIMTGYDHHRWNDEKKERLFALKSPEVMGMRRLIDKILFINEANHNKHGPILLEEHCDDLQPTKEAYDRLVERLEKENEKS